MFGFIKKSGCRCATYPDLEDYPAVEKRRQETKKIVKTLKQLEEHANRKNILYQCPVCNQHWQTSMEWMGGDTLYVYKVPPIDLTSWREKPFVCPAELFIRVWRIGPYLEKVKFEEKAGFCKSEGCAEHAIRLSSLCAFHHMENIGMLSKLPEDRTWFEPYTKDNYEFTIEQLKKLPNYKAL